LDSEEAETTEHRSKVNYELIELVQDKTTYLR